MKMKILALALVSAALGATNVAAQTDRFDGIYKPRGAEFSNWNCKNIGEDGGAVAVKNGEIWGVESLCQLSKPLPINGMDAVLYDADCGGEGEQWTERVMLMKADFGIYLIKDSFVSEWESCPIK